MSQPAEQMTIETDASQEAQQYEMQTKDLLASAQSIEVKTADDYERANEELKRIKSKAKELEERRKSLTKPLDESKKRIMNLFRPALDFLSDAEKAIKNNMLEFNREQERVRREEEARLREQQRKEQEKLRQKADKARERGKEEQAAAYESQAEQTQGAVVQSNIPKTSSTVRKTWKARVTDKAALIKAAAERQDLQALLTVDEKALNGMARALKDQMQIPGVEPYEDETISTRV